MRKYIYLLPIAGAFFLYLVIIPGAAAEAPSPAAATQNTDAPKAALDIFLVLDNSGSMKKSDPDLLIRSVVKDFLQTLGAESRLGIVVFDDQARVVQFLTAMDRIDAKNELTQRLGQIDYRGRFTNTPAAVERAIYELKTNGREEAFKIIVLITDGIVDTGNRTADIEQERWLKEDLARESKAAGIQIFGIAFTDQADFRLLQTLALRTDAAYYRVYQTREIRNVLGQIRQSVSTFEPAVERMPKPTPSESAPPQSPKTPQIRPSKPASLPEKEPSKPDWVTFLPAILSALAVFLGIFYLRRILLKSTAGPAAKTESNAGISAVPKMKTPAVQAQLIDADNIITDQSISLLLEKESTSIGRDSSNDIVIPRESVSSLHASIDFRNGYYYLEDHRSTNGTRLNNKKVREKEPVRLKSGDTIHFANFEFRFLLPDQAPLGETIMIDNA